MLKDVWDQGAPCWSNPAFTQQGEDNNWDHTPAAREAINICNTICDRRTACATRALTSGTIPGERFTTVADGVIYAGIPCKGDHATLLALHTVAGTKPNDTHCPGCDREFLDPTATVINLGQCRRAALGLCSACYKSKKKSGTLPALRTPPPAACLACEAPFSELRPHARGGRCRPCADAHRYQQRKAAA